MISFIKQGSAFPNGISREPEISQKNPGNFPYYSSCTYPGLATLSTSLAVVCACFFFTFAYLLFYSQVGHPLTLSLLLSCPQISTAHIMTSKQCSFVGGLSEKTTTLALEHYSCLERSALSRGTLATNTRKRILGKEVEGERLIVVRSLFLP